MSGFGELLSDLNAAGLRYVVVGGLAVIRHGVVRATRDVDVVVSADDATGSILARLIAQWGATRPDGSPEDRRVPSRGWPLHLRSPHGLVDFLAEEPPPLDLEALLARADTRDVEGVPAPICALEDLVALKRRAGQPTDQEDLRRLELAHGALPPDPGGSDPQPS